jgi:hypothetical protein
MPNLSRRKNCIHLTTQYCVLVRKLCILVRKLCIARYIKHTGAYVGQNFDKGENAHDRSKRITTGAKPLWLMQAIIRDYSKPGQLVVDPCAGGATTLIAAEIEGRSSVGSEIDVKTYGLAMISHTTRSKLPEDLPCEELGSARNNAVF